MPNVPKIPAPKDWNQVIAVLESFRSEFRMAIEGLTIRMDRLERELMNLSQSVGRLEDAMPVLMSDIACLKRDLADMTRDMTVVKRDVSGFKIDNATFLTRLDRLETKVGLN